jgi:flagellar assembly protein FliH
MSSSSGYNGAFPVPITALQYRDMADGALIGAHSNEPGGRSAEDSGARLTDTLHLEAELIARVKQERSDAAREVEQRMRAEAEQMLATARMPLASALAAFEEQRNEYFAKVEAEVVQLALAIAAKILHREAQVDPMLVATLVRIAIEKLREGSSVNVRVSPSRAKSWEDYFASQSTAARVEVIADPQLSDHDCLVETELGSANFGLDTQLKEVEQGFFDLLALRPASR